MSALESLDVFLARTPEDRGLTRALRRHLNGFKGVVITGATEPARAVGLRLLDTLPLGNVFAVAVDGPAHRRGMKTSSEVEWSDSGPNPPVAMLRAMLRQDPDVIVAVGLGSDDVEMMLQAMATGHLVIGTVPFPTRDAFLDSLRAGPLAPLLPIIPAVLELDAAGKLKELWQQTPDGWQPASREVQAPAAVETRPTYAPVRPPPASSPQARVSYVPRVEAGAKTPHRIGTASVLLPSGTGWALCRGCQAPMRHVLQLTGGELPAPLRRSSKVVQLFLCEQGCESFGEDPPGVTLLSLPPEGLVETEHPAGAAATFGGGVVSFFERAEDPHPEDVPATAREDDEEDRGRPWDCDKLGGWPRWEQGAEWPEHGTQRMELLFQLAESGDVTPGRRPGWDDEASEEIPGSPDVPRLDPERPVHIPGVLSGGDGRGFLFRSVVDPDVLRFVWQTS